MSISIKTYKLSEEQKEAVNPQNNAWVQANAGSGKTEILAGRLLRILFRYKQNGKDITKIPGVLCLTFTETGVGEMKDRIIKTFRKWSMAYDEDLREAISLVIEGNSPTENDMKIARQIFFDVIDNPDILQVCTIHSFCSDVLKHFSLEAGLPPAWSVILEYDKRVLLEKTFEKMINNTNMSSRVDKALQHIVSDQSESVMDTIYEILTKKYKTLFNIDDKPAYRTYFESKLKEYLKIDNTKNVEPTPAELEIIKNEFIKLSDQQEDANIKKFYNKLAKSVETYIEDKDNFDMYKEVFLTDNLKPLSYKNVTNINGEKIRQCYLKDSPVLAKEAERVSQYAEFRYKNKVYEDTMAMFDLVVEFGEMYKKAKHAYNVLDFDDLILYTTKLFENPITMGAVLQQLSTSFGHILVDEAQDTSSQQWKIFNTLRDNIALQGYASLVVGDSKQAIFGFQDADTKGFATNREYFKTSVEESGNGEFHPVTLTTNYRSLSPILDTVDYFFDKFTKDEKTPAEIEIKFNNSKHSSFRSDRFNQKGGLVEMHKAFIPTESKDAAKKEYAKYLADEIERVLNTEKVYDEDKKDVGLRKVTPNDIMVLVRGRNRVITYLLRFLKDKDIAVAGEDKIILNDFLPVRDLLNLIRFSIRDKYNKKFTDDYALGCILKSPLYRLSESQIYDLCKEQQSLTTDDHKELLWNILKKNYPDIHTDLSEICEKCVSEAPYTFFNFVLSKKFNSEYTNRQKMISAMGKNIVDPLEEFLTQCLVYERTQSGTTKDFLKWFITSRPEAKRDVKSSDGIKVMTIHGCKGLESPIVFMIDTFRKGNKNSPLLDLNFLNASENELYDLWAWNKVKLENLPKQISIDKNDHSGKEELEEYYRLLYVAMTRARDQLYIYGLGEKRRESSSNSDTSKKKTAPKKITTSPSWYPLLWQELSKIAVAVPSAATKDYSTEEPEITTIRITDDPEIKNFFNN